MQQLESEVDGRPEAEDGVAALWRTHCRWVAAVVYSHMPRGADLDDLLQEVAMKLVRNIHRLHDPGALRPWLRTVAMNVARSAGRKHKVRSRVMRSFDRMNDDEVSFGAAAGSIHRASEDTLGRGRRALELAGGLPVHYREPLLLSVRGLSQRQIAEALGVPLTTIETRLVRARRMIRDEMLSQDNAVDVGAGPSIAGTIRSSNLRSES